MPKGATIALGMAALDVFGAAAIELAEERKIVSQGCARAIACNPRLAGPVLFCIMNDARESLLSSRGEETFCLPGSSMVTLEVICLLSHL
jgi:hypothetical protein